MRKLIFKRKIRRICCSVSHNTMHTCLAIECLCKLVDCWRNFESLLKNCQLALKADVLWPSHKAAKISFGLNILPCNIPSKKLVADVRGSACD